MMRLVLVGALVAAIACKREKRTFAVALFLVVLVVGMAVPTFMLWTGAEP